MRAADAGAAADALAAELARPLPFATLVLETGTAVVEGIRFPAELPAGHGVVAIGRYRGTLPRTLSVTAIRGGDVVHAPLAAAGGELARAALPLWLGGADVEDFVPLADRLPDTASSTTEYAAGVWAAARRGFLAAAVQAHAVTADSALVALDPDDAFARDRLAMVKKWGPTSFGRLPPPAERAQGYGLSAEERPARRRPREEAAVAARDLAPTGDLDPDIVWRLLRTTMLPRAKACYDRALRGHPDLGGGLDLVVEIARGEVTTASIHGSSLGDGDLERCVLDAAFALDPPRIALGDEPDAITIARYPLTFRVVRAAGSVSDEQRPALPPTGADPLDGLPPR